MATMQKITFFSRFEADILSGKKTITIRDHTESHFQVGQTLCVFTLETDRLFAHINVKAVLPIDFADLNRRHAIQYAFGRAESGDPLDLPEPVQTVCD